MHPWSPSRQKQLVIVNSFYIFLCYIRLFRIQMSRKYFHGDRTPRSFPENKKRKKNEKRAAPHDVCQEQQQLQLSLS